MDRIAAKIAQEIAMLLDDGDIDPRPRQKQTEHHARRPTADDGNRGLYGLGVVVVVAWHGKLLCHHA